MSAATYRLTQSEIGSIASGRLADIERMIAEGDTSADWAHERSEQLRLIAEIAA